MADVKVSALTALTGANLANGDQFLVTDVGSPNVSKSITADELAQGSQFSSRYKPLASDVLWIPASTMSVTDTAPTEASVYVGPVWFMDDSTVEGVGSNFVLPPGWATFHVDFYWSAAATSGDVLWNLYLVPRTVGQDVTTGVTTFGEVATVAATANHLSVKRMATSQSAVSGAIWQIGCLRVGQNALDTMTGDAAFHGALLTRAS